MAPASNPWAITQGSDGNMWFVDGTTGHLGRVIPDVPPVVATGPASSVTQTTATLAGSVRSRGAETSYYFQYGTTTGYGAATPTAGNGSGDSMQGVEVGLGGLGPSTTYHYRLIATNAYGQSYGADQSLTTAAVPPPPPPPTTSVPLYTVTLTLEPRGGHARLSSLTLRKLVPGLHVSYSCVHCSGSHQRSSRTSRSAALRIATQGASPVSTHSRLLLNVAAQDRSSRNRTYSFRPYTRPITSFREVCRVPQLVAPISCG